MKDWRADAVCTTVDPELFFVGGYPSAWHHHPDAAAKAKAICVDCPVIAECLAFAIERGDKDSVAGGLTPKEREALIRKAKRKALPKPTKCLNGHDITKPDARDRNRVCRQCKRDKEARYRKRKREAAA